MKFKKSNEEVLAQMLLNAVGEINGFGFNECSECAWGNRCLIPCFDVWLKYIADTEEDNSKSGCNCENCKEQSEYIKTEQKVDTKVNRVEKMTEGEQASDVLTYEILKEGFKLAKEAKENQVTTEENDIYLVIGNVVPGYQNVVEVFGSLKDAKEFLVNRTARDFLDGLDGEGATYTFEVYHPSVDCKIPVNVSLEDANEAYKILSKFGETEVFLRNMIGLEHINLSVTLSEDNTRSSITFLPKGMKSDFTIHKITKKDGDYSIIEL